MNLKRIAIYVGLMFLATGIAGFVFGFIRGALKAEGIPIPFSFVVTQAVAVLTVSVLVFARLAIVQPARTFAHAWTVALASWLVGFPVSVLIMGDTLLSWFAQSAFFAVTLVIGVPLGKAWGRRHGRNLKAALPEHGDQVT